MAFWRNRVCGRTVASQQSVSTRKEVLWEIGLGLDWWESGVRNIGRFSRWNPLMAAYLPNEGLVLMQGVVEGKGGEIPTLPKLLNSIDLRDKVLMGDALHTQREVSIRFIETGGD